MAGALLAVTVEGGGVVLLPVVVDIHGHGSSPGSVHLSSKLFFLQKIQCVN